MTDRDDLARAEAPYPTDLYPGCPCAACDHRNVMNLCPSCGNKRCPAAMDHARFACARSNEHGQTPTHLAATSRPDVGDLRERVAEAVQSVTLSTAEGCDCDLPPEYDGHTPADAAGRLRALLAEDDTEAHG